MNLFQYLKRMASSIPIRKTIRIHPTDRNGEGAIHNQHFLMMTIDYLQLATAGNAETSTLIPKTGNIGTTQAMGPIRPRTPVEFGENAALLNYDLESHDQSHGKTARQSSKDAVPLLNQPEGRHNQLPPCPRHPAS